VHETLLPKGSSRLLSSVGTEPNKKNLRECERDKVPYPYQQQRGRCRSAFHVGWKGKFCGEILINSFCWQPFMQSTGVFSWLLPAREQII